MLCADKWLFSNDLPFVAGITHFNCFFYLLPISLIKRYRFFNQLINSQRDVSAVKSIAKTRTKHFV